MKLMAKQLGKELLKNKVYLVLISLLSCFTTAMFFYWSFPVDGNLDALNTLPSLTKNQGFYKQALLSNIILGKNLFNTSIAVTALVFAMFFYRFFKTGKRQIGCLKALGFKDKALSSYFVFFTAALSIFSALPGVIIGYFTADTFLEANMQSYPVTGLVKSVSAIHFFIGLLVPTLVFCVTALFCYGFVRGKETGILLSGATESHKESKLLYAAAKIADLIPVKDKFPVRIALRKPIGIIILIFAVVGLQVFHIIGSSLIPSSQIIYDSQIEGHHYQFETNYTDYHEQKDSSNEILHAVSIPSAIVQKDDEIDFPLVATGAEYRSAVLDLVTPDGKSLAEPVRGTCGTIANFTLRL